MVHDTRASGARLAETTLVMMLADLAGFTRVVSGFDAIEIARIVDDFYTLAAEQVRARDGRVVKYSGDNCLATFDARAGSGSVQCATAIRDDVQVLGDRHGVELDAGINIHRATVVAGHFGPESDAQYDLIGAGVIHLFRMGSGAGIRISEPVYRQLPNDERPPWHKHQPPATYTLAS
jgi:class 3 adenylate cyclase